MRRVAPLALAGILALGASACAPDENTSSSPSSTSPAAAASTTTPFETPSPEVSATSASPAATDATSGSSDSASPAMTTASDASTASSTTSGAATDAAANEPIDLNVKVTSVAQIPTKLAKTSKDFQAYVTKLAKESGKTASGGTCPNFTIEVDKYWPSNDQAMGSVTACGGYMAVWFTDARGTWQEFGYQSVPYCQVVRAVGVPNAIDLATGFGCLEKGSTEMVAYTPEA